jgi:hypothetical protein
LLRHVIHAFIDVPFHVGLFLRCHFAATLTLPFLFYPSSQSWYFGEVWPTGVDKNDVTIGLPIPSPSFVPPNATQTEIALLPISLVEGRILNLNNDDDAGSLNFHELKNSLIPPGHLDPSLKGKRLRRLRRLRRQVLLDRVLISFSFQDPSVIPS